MLQSNGAPLIHGEFDELDTGAKGFGRESFDVGKNRARAPAEFVEHDDQGALTVDGDATRGTRSEAVVEYLKGQEPVESCRMKRVHEIIDGQVALSREAAVMPAPGQVIHVEPWRIGHL